MDATARRILRLGAPAVTCASERSVVRTPVFSDPSQASHASRRGRASCRTVLSSEATCSGLRNEEVIVTSSQQPRYAVPCTPRVRPVPQWCVASDCRAELNTYDVLGLRPLSAGGARLELGRADGGVADGGHADLDFAWDAGERLGPCPVVIAADARWRSTCGRLERCVWMLRRSGGGCCGRGADPGRNDGGKGERPEPG